MPVNGTIKLSGDKSISHRAILLSSIISGESRLKNISNSDDIKSTINCLVKCGIKMSYIDDSLLVTGNTFRNPKNSLDCGNSGTSARLLIGLLSGLGIKAKIIGDKSLTKRPMRRIIEPLTLMGASINGGTYLPLSLNTENPLLPINYSMPISSAQVKSCILFASLNTTGETKIKESYNSRNHTEIMLKECGCEIIFDKDIIIKNPSKKLSPIFMDIPGDSSSAAFMIVLAAMIPDSKLYLKNILCNQSRIKYIDLINSMGGDIKIKNKRMAFGEIVGDILVKYKPLRAINIKREIIPQIIDEIPILCLLATQAKGETIFNGINELRYKESNRVEAIKINLKSMGANILLNEDKIKINGPNILHNTSIKTYSDHRIAMTFTIAGLLSGKFNHIDDESCIDTSFPNFYNILKEISL